MREVDALRARLMVALVLALPGCGKDEADDAVSVQFGKIGGGSPTKVKVPDPEGEAETGDGGSTGPATPPVDPVEFCRTAAMTFAKTDAAANRRPGTAEQHDCPVSIDSASGRGTLSLRESATELLRNAGDTEHCCYEEVPEPERYPHVVKGRPLTLASGDWLPQVRRGRVDAPIVHARAAEAWLQDARAEHASVASFERAARELRAVGAPVALVRACRRAAADERRHAAACLAIARRLGGGVASLQALPAAPERPGDLAMLLRHTFAEGCVAETIAALVATTAATTTRDDDIAAVLRTIADEEADHAALAWRTMAWGIGRLPPKARAELLAWARAMRPAAPRAATGGAASDPDAAWGRLGGATEAAIADRAWAACIVPLLDRLAPRVGSAAYGQLPEVTVSPLTGTPSPGTSANASAIDWQ